MNNHDNHLLQVLLARQAQEARRAPHQNLQVRVAVHQKGALQAVLPQAQVPQEVRKAHHRQQYREALF